MLDILEDEKLKHRSIFERFLHIADITYFIVVVAIIILSLFTFIISLNFKGDLENWKTHSTLPVLNVPSNSVFIHSLNAVIAFSFLSSFFMLSYLIMYFIMKIEKYFVF
jgi:hypothetical protein